MAASQYRTDTREQFARPEWLGKVVVRTEFEANDAIDFVAAMTCRYDDRHIRARPDRTQQIQSIVLAELQIKDNQTLLVGEMSHGAVAIGGRDDAHAVLGEIVLNHPTNGAIVLDEEHLCAPSGILVGATAKRCVRRRLSKLSRLGSRISLMNPFRHTPTCRHLGGWAAIGSARTQIVDVPNQASKSHLHFATVRATSRSP